MLWARSVYTGGSDLTRMPCSYSQCVRLFTDELRWLSGNDLEWIVRRAISAKSWAGRSQAGAETESGLASRAATEAGRSPAFSCVSFGGVMFKHILMPTDGSEHSERAVERGIELAKLCGAKVTGIHVMPDYRMMIATEGLVSPGVDENLNEQAREQATRFLSFVQRAAEAAGVACETVIATGQHPYDAIVDTANDRGCDLIVMTARYRKGLMSMIMGSEANRVLHRTSIPLLTFRALVSADHPDKAQIKPMAGR